MKKTLLVCALAASACALHAQHVTLAPEAGVSAVMRGGWGQS